VFGGKMNTKLLKLIMVAICLAALYFFIFDNPHNAYADVSHCGTISSDETWASGGNVHKISCDVTVGSGVTLTITEGAIIKFADGKSLIINGSLQVQGIATNKVYFTSYRDDTIGGDTDGDGGANNPARGDWTNIKFNSIMPSQINFAVIRYGGYNAGQGYVDGAIQLADGSPTIQNTQIIESRYCAIAATLHSFPTLNNNNLSNNDANGLCIYGGTLDIDATWNTTDTSYYLRGLVTVGANKTLTIANGVVIKMKGDNDLVVNGALQAQGSIDHKVYFTSYRDDTIGGDTDGDGGASNSARGDWTNIKFNSTMPSQINFAVIRYGGYNAGQGYVDGAIQLADGSPTIQNTQIIESRYCAIAATLHSFPTLNNNNLSNNDANGLCIYGGTLDIDATWNTTDTSYYLRGLVTVGANKTLTIANGVVIKMKGDNDLVVNGALQAQGSIDHKVYFTSYRDDTIGGDTDGDGGASNSARGDWTNIKFNSTMPSQINFAVIRYGGGNGAVTVMGGALTLSNTNLTENSNAGIYSNQATPNLGCNNIYSNTKYGIYNNTPTTIINAENQWWGSTSGPYHSTNSGGTGNAVTDGVDFTPWRTSPCGTPPVSPSNLQATTFSGNEIDLTWNDNSSDETGFRIERSLNGTSNWTEIGVVGANIIFYKDVGLSCSSATYYYRVRAYRQTDGLYSQYSNVDSAATQPCPPSDLIATTVSKTQIDLSWQDNSSDETQFYIERSLNGSTNWSIISSVGANITQYSNTGLMCGTNYYYRVRAFRQVDGIYSAYSNVSPATTLECNKTYVPFVTKSQST
jgi:hypothetical protein